MIEAIILAAGEGTRLGEIKPLVSVGTKTALERTIDTCRQAGIERVVVVLGHAADKIADRVRLDDCTVVVNRGYREGMGSSLAAGIASLDDNCRGFLIMHADMPCISDSTVCAVIAEAEKGARIAAPTYRGERGFPVYLSSTCIGDLLPTLNGEVGARGYIAEHASELKLVPVDDWGAVFDIDSAADLDRVEDTT